MNNAASDTFCIETVHGLKQQVSVDTEGSRKRDLHLGKSADKSVEPSAQRQPPKSS